MVEIEYYKSQIKDLKYTVKKLRTEVKMLTGINASMLHEISPLEDIYYSTNYGSKKKNASFKDVIKHITRVLKNAKH